MRIPDWVGDFFENRGWLGLVQYSSTNGLNVSGTPVSYESVTYSQFTDVSFDLTTARHVIVTDRHSTRDASDECKSLWWIEPSNPTGYKRVLRSPPIYCATSAALPSASTFKNGRAYRADLGPEGCDMLSDGTGWCPVQNSVIYRNTDKIAVVCPAAVFGSPTVGNAGGYVQLTGAGNHSLTQAVCVTAGVSYIYISAGTAWTPGLYQIRSVTDASAVLVLELAYSASYGSPTVAKIGDGVDIPMRTITLPRLRARSKITIDVSHGFPNTAGSKAFKLSLSSTTLYSNTLASLGLSNRGIFAIYNRSVSSQIAGAGPGAFPGVSSGSAAQSTAAVDTSTGSATATISYSPATVNEVCIIEACEAVVS